MLPSLSHPPEDLALISARVSTAGFILKGHSVELGCIQGRGKIDEQ